MNGDQSIMDVNSSQLELYGEAEKSPPHAFLPFRFVVEGHPIVLKNGKQICFNKKTGRRFVKSNARVEAWMEKAIALLGFAWDLPSVSCRVAVKLTFYGAWKVTGGTTPDLSNLLQGPEDAMQRAGVIEDDRLIESHDGSRRVYMCDTCMDRPIFKAGPKKGSRKPDCGAIKKCPYERVVIELMEFDG